MLTFAKRRRERSKGNVGKLSMKICHTEKDGHILKLTFWPINKDLVICVCIYVVMTIFSGTVLSSRDSWLIASGKKLNLRPQMEETVIVKTF